MPFDSAAHFPEICFALAFSLHLSLLAPPPAFTQWARSTPRFSRYDSLPSGVGLSHGRYSAVSLSLPTPLLPPTVSFLATLPLDLHHLLHNGAGTFSLPMCRSFPSSSCPLQLTPLVDRSPPTPRCGVCTTARSLLLSTSLLSSGVGDCVASQWRSFASTGASRSGTSPQLAGWSCRLDSVLQATRSVTHSVLRARLRFRHPGTRLFWGFRPNRPPLSLSSFVFWYSSREGSRGPKFFYKQCGAPSSRHTLPIPRRACTGLGISFAMPRSNSVI